MPTATTECVSSELIARASALSSASLHEAAGKTGALPAEIKPVVSTMRLCGWALPVRCPAGDNLWIHRALEQAEPGSVLVVETGAGVEFGYWGEIMAAAAMVRHLAGLVISGGVRDTLALIELGLPTFSATMCIHGTVKNPQGDGAVGEPVRLANTMVRKGDLLFGDADGVVVLSPSMAERAVPAAEQRDAAENRHSQEVSDGAPRACISAGRTMALRKDRIIKELARGGHIGLFMGDKTLKVHWSRIGKWIVQQGQASG